MIDLTDYMKGFGFVFLVIIWEALGTSLSFLSLVNSLNITNIKCLQVE